MRSSLASAIFLAAIIVLGGCKKNDDDPAPPVGGGTGGTLTAGTVPFVQMTLDGASVSYTQGTTYGSFTDFASDIATPPASSTAHYTFVMHPVSEPDSPVFAVSLGTYNFQGSSPTDAQFFGFFPTGTVQHGESVRPASVVDGIARFPDGVVPNTGPGPLGEWSIAFDVPTGSTLPNPFNEENVDDIVIVFTYSGDGSSYSF